MKHYLLAGLLLAAVPALAQTAPPVGQEAAQPFKGATTIIIHTPDSAAVAYKKLAAVLLGTGYSLDRADKELLFLSTKQRPAPRYNMEHSMRASIVSAKTGSDIRLQDSFVLPGAAAVASFMAGSTETIHKGGPNSTLMICWNEMQRVAALYPGGKLAFIANP